MTRHRSDTVKGAQEIINGALEAINPPVAVELGYGVRPYWDKLVKAKAGRSWNDQDLLMLVELSRNLFRTERLSFQMLTEDEILETGQGLKANPKKHPLSNNQRFSHHCCIRHFIYACKTPVNISKVSLYVVNSSLNSKSYQT